MYIYDYPGYLIYPTYGKVIDPPGMIYLVKHFCLSWIIQLHQLRQSQRLSCIEKKCFSFLKHVFEFWPLPSFSLLRKFSNFILMIFLTLKGRGGHNAPPP